MAASAGRLLRIKKGSGAGAAVVAGARTDNLTINNEAIDVTDKDDIGWRTLLAVAGARSIDCDVEGILVDDTLMDIAAGAEAGLLDDYEIDVAAIGVFAGDFFLTSFTIGGEQAEGITFTANLQSSGAVTYTGDA